MRRRLAGPVALGLGLLVAGLVAPAARAPGAAAVTVPTFTFGGAGFGHGVGLSQYGARGQALDGRRADDIVRYYYTGASVSALTDSTDLKVNLVDRGTRIVLHSEAVSASGGLLEVVLAGVGVRQVGPTDTVTVTVAGARLAVVLHYASGATVSLSTTGITARWAGTRQWRAARTSTGAATVLHVDATVQSGASAARADNGTYRWGDVTLVPQAIREPDGVTRTKLEAINRVRLHDEYLRGVAEMPSSWPIEALRAQAVAARTYAYRAYRANPAGRSACGGCHVYDSTRDQVFAGWSKEHQVVGTTDYGSRWSLAVAGTAVTASTGKVLTVAGAPIAAYFYSSSGGRTRASEDVWSSPLSYARPVDDHWSLDPAVNPTYSSWTRTVAAATLRSKAFPSLASVARVAVTSIDSGGAARAVTAWSPTGTSASVSGNVLRTALGLPSAWVYRVTSTLATQPAVAAVDAFVTPGYHVVSGREWLTSCASYGSASGKRCWAWIKATKTSWTGTSYVTHYGWVLDMLTYVDRVSPSWATNPLARPGPFTSAGHAWTTACWPGGVTSPRTCRTWIWAVVATRTATASGGYTYSRRWAWVVNNQVRLTAA